MGEDSQNPYQVLRIERTADERAVKKAYFTLVREFTPDQHPEDFKRIRAAYEVLSDPVARQRFDAADKSFEEYGDEVAAELRDIEETVKSGTEAAAQEKLLRLIEQRPDLLIARENLAFSYLRSDAFKEALHQFELLSEKKPEEARYHLYRGIALSRLDRRDEALVSLRAAHERKPDDLRIHFALIDLLVARRELGACLRAIDAAMEHHGQKNESSLALSLRRVEALFTMGDLKPAQSEVDALIERVLALEDPELPAYTSSQLAGVAAKLFARDKPDRANALLGRCVELTPDSLVARPFPEAARVDVAELSTEARAWLAALERGPTTPTLDTSVWPAPTAAFIAASAAAILSLYWLLDAPDDAGFLDVLSMAPLFGAIAVALAWSVRRAIAIVSSPIRGFSTVHALYYIVAKADVVDLYPLFRLSDLSATHFHQNGGYTHTAVTISFGSKVMSLRFNDKGYAQSWISYLSGRRGRSLELLAEGCLEADHGVELFPPALLTSPRGSAATRRASLVRWYGGAVACALLTALVMAPLRVRGADSHAYALAVRAGTSAAYRDYVAARPGGRHAARAKELAAAPYARAAEALQTKGDPGAPGAKALAAALDALRAAGETTVPVRITSAVEPSLLGNLGRSNSAFEASAVAERESALVARLARMLEGAGLGEALTLKLAPRDVYATGPVTLALHRHTRPEGARLVAEGLPNFPSVEVLWDAELSESGAPEPLHRFEVLVGAPAEIAVPRPRGAPGDVLAADVLSRIEDAAFDAFATRFAAELGLPEAPPAQKVAPAANRVSPYE